MGFSMYKNQIERRLEGDEKQFRDAFAELASILDAEFIKRADAENVSGAISEVLASIGVESPRVPENLGDTREKLAYMLRYAGVMRRRVELSGPWWKNASGSFLCSMKNGEVIAITRKRLRYQYRDKSGKAIPVNKETAKNISADAFCFYRPFPDREMDMKDLFCYMLGCIKVSDIIFIAGTVLLVSLVGMLTPYFNSQLFDNVIPSGHVGNIPLMASVMTGAMVGASLFGIIRLRLINLVRANINLSVKSAAMMRMLSLPVSFFKDYTAGELASRLDIFGELCSMLVNTVLSTGLTVLFSFVYVYQMAKYAPELALPGCLIILATLGISFAQPLSMLKYTRKGMLTRSKLSGVTYAIFSGIQKIKLAGAQKRAFAKWAKDYAENAKCHYFSSPRFAVMAPAISGLVSMSGALWLYYLAGSSRLSASAYMAFNSAYGTVSGAIMSMGAIASAAVLVKPMSEMILPILRTKPESAGGREIVRSLSGNIEVSGLTFRYDKNSPPVLNELSLKIKSGEFVAVVGESGCGKSTLLRLLLGFETPERGAVYYDGKDIKGLDLPSVRRRIGACLQNGKLFAGDIFSNIVVTSPDATLDDAWRAAEMAGFGDDIRGMPMGMRTVISEGGGGVSGGQKQRLLIARAIVSTPKILFFDEATSALDNITQKRVTESVSSLKCTRLVIAHRLSTIRRADRIVVMEKGRIVEEGDYYTLMEKQGRFYELARRQVL